MSHVFKKDLEAQFITESIDLGPALGLRDFTVFNSGFNAVCAQEADTDDDCTGLRIYPGAHVLVRLLSHTHEVNAVFFQGKRCLELGCGAGVVTVASLLGSLPDLYVATDGNADCIKLVERNVARLCGGRASACHLYPMKWIDNDIDHVLHRVGAGHNSFSIAIASELMYYNTDLEQLVYTLQQVVDIKHGLFLSCHGFRVQGQLEKWLDLLESRLEWVTYVAELDSFALPDEIAENPSWYNTRTLLSGSTEAVTQAIQTLGPSVQWQEARVQIQEEEAEEKREDDNFLMNIGQL